MKLELKHLAPYLPYGLKMMSGYYLVGLANCNRSTYNEKHDTRMMLLSETVDGDIAWEAHSNMDMPYLRKLSDLTKEIEVNGERFVPLDWFEIGDDNNVSIEYDYGNIKLINLLESLSVNSHCIDTSHLPYGATKKLFEWHFDVFALIEAGLAIDINTLD